MTRDKYKLVERTPEEMRCAIIGCPAIYEVTPKDMRCGLLACPAVYEVTPEKMQCAFIGCESIYSEKENNTYLIVGKQVNPEEFGLAKKVGQGEILIQVPRDLIDKMERD